MMNGDSMSVKRRDFQFANVDRGAAKKAKYGQPCAEMPSSPASLSQLGSPFTSELLEICGTSKPFIRSPDASLGGVHKSIFGPALGPCPNFNASCGADLYTSTSAPQGGDINGSMAEASTLDSFAPDPAWPLGQFLDLSQFSPQPNSLVPPAPSPLLAEGLFGAESEVSLQQPLNVAGLLDLSQTAATRSQDAAADGTWAANLSELEHAVVHHQPPTPFMADTPFFQNTHSQSAPSSATAQVPIEPGIRNLLNHETSWEYGSQMPQFFAEQDKLISIQTKTYQGFYWRVNQHQELARLQQLQMHQLAHLQTKYFELMPPEFHSDTERITAFYKQQLAQAIHFCNDQLNAFAYFEDSLNW